MRYRLVALLLTIGLGLVPGAGGAPVLLVPAELPADFHPRFLDVCKRRGLSDARCACMSEVFLREVADEHLALMLEYLESPATFNSRAHDELDADEARMRILEEEIATAHAATRAECHGR